MMWEGTRLEMHSPPGYLTPREWKCWVISELGLQGGGGSSLLYPASPPLPRAPLRPSAYVPPRAPSC